MPPNLEGLVRQANQGVDGGPPDQDPVMAITDLNPTENLWNVSK